MKCGVLFLKSNFKKEKWHNISVKEETYRATTVLRPPERPPPRTLSDLNSEVNTEA